MLDAETREDLLDALYDLKHDLGKYIRLPVGMLPNDASQDTVRNALKTALYETRKRGTEAISARELWDHFETEWKVKAEMFSSYRDLKEAVKAALGLESLLKQLGTIIERESVLETLAKVGEEISRLLEEVETNGK